MKIILLCALMFLTFGCSSASYVLKPSATPKENQPIGYKPIGVVKYLNQGADSVINSSRAEAFKKMADSCGGKYRIVKEEEKADNNNMIKPTGDVWTMSSYNYWYITYECVN